MKYDRELYDYVDAYSSTVRTAELCVTRVTVMSTLHTAVLPCSIEFVVLSQTTNDSELAASQITGPPLRAAIGHGESLAQTPAALPR